MRHLIRLTDGWNRATLQELFGLAEAHERGGRPSLHGSAVMFFPATCLRTRVSFKLGAARLGLTTVTMPPEALDTGEAKSDVAGYLAQWADLLVVRHPDITVLESLAETNTVPVINAMTAVNHPCEVLSDLYALSRTRDPFGLRYVLFGPDGNIARAWLEAARAFGLELLQACPKELATKGIRCMDDPIEAARGADVILTDSPGGHEAELAPYRVTTGLLDLAAAGVQLVPCPPFSRGRELTAEAAKSEAFVGYAFKRALLPVQQAIMELLLGR